MNATDRFLKYITFETTSNEYSDTTPSSLQINDFALYLKKELESLGADKVTFDDRHGYLYASIDPTPGKENLNKIGFIAHMDTSPDFNGGNVHPQIIHNYDGKDVKLSDSGRILSPEMFPELALEKGRTLITTDGNSLLGADDKAGIAAIMTMLESVKNNNVPHCQINVAFTPDEEIGKGTDYFDSAVFDSDFAYTVDGDSEGEIVFENFNAATAVIQFNGRNVHPGSAKNIMINASKVAIEFDSLLPSMDVPSQTEGYQGFYHICNINGNIEKAEAVYIIRDHDLNIFNQRKECMRRISNLLNKKYGEGTVKISINDSYFNMKEVIKNSFHLVENAREVIKSLGLEPLENPIRGGTDGARLSFDGIPCPNLGTGGHAFHGPYEYITSEGLELSTEILIGLVKKYSE